MKRIDTDILILGAGWSGLVAADLLSSRGRKVVILEKETEVGGLARTFNFRGFKFDLGGHCLFFKDMEDVRYIKNIISNGNIMGLRRKTKVFFDNKYIDYPPNLYSILKLGKKYLPKILSDMVILNKNYGNDNFENWVKTNYGETLYRIYFKDYTEKVWGESCDNISVAWADKRIGKNNLLKIIKKIFLNGGYNKYDKRRFYYPRDGIGTLASALEQRIKKNNCLVYKGVKLNQISMNNGKPAFSSFVYEKNMYEIEFNQLISSIPILELYKILPHEIASDIQEPIKGIKYRNLICINFIINKNLVTNWHWCYFPTKDIIFSRLHEPKFWSKSLAPENKTLICAEVFCSNDDLYWNMKEEELIKRVENAMKYSEVISDRGIIQDAMVKKIEYTYPLHYNGFEKPLNQIKRVFSNFNNFHTVGRSGKHSYFDMEECLKDACQTVNFIMEKNEK